MAHFRAMVDMAKSPADVKKEMGSCMPCAPACEPKVPVYPYGLCLSLDEECLAKMDMEGEMPKVGEMIHLCAMATVTSCSQSERVDESGNKTNCCRIELQITHLATENEDEESAREEATEQRRGRFYGNTDGDDGKKAA
jgi:hypothetical protein